MARPARPAVTPRRALLVCAAPRFSAPRMLRAGAKGFRGWSRRCLASEPGAALMALGQCGRLFPPLTHIASFVRGCLRAARQ